MTLFIRDASYRAHELMKAEGTCPDTYWMTPRLTYPWSHLLRQLALSYGYSCVYEQSNRYIRTNVV